MSSYENDLRDLIAAGVDPAEAVSILEDGIPEEPFDTPDWPDASGPSVFADESQEDVRKRAANDPQWQQIKRGAERLHRERMFREDDAELTAAETEAIERAMADGLTQEQAEAFVLDDPRKWDAVIDDDGKRLPDDPGEYFS